MEEVKEADNVKLESSITKNREQTSAEKLEEALLDELDDSDDEKDAVSTTETFNLKIQAKTQK